MQHWWKWALIPAIAFCLPIVVGSAHGLITGSPPTTSGIAEAATPWPAWTDVSTTLVPIVSAGTPGIRLGLAQVSGPSRLVKQVRAVLQIDGDFNGVRAKVLVPSNSLTDLRRVQGTAVTAFAQYEVLGFTGKDKKATASQQPRTTPCVHEKVCCKHGRLGHPCAKHKKYYRHHCKHNKHH